MSSEVTASPTFRRSLINNANVTQRVRRKPSRLALRLDTSVLSSAHASTTIRSPSNAGTPTKSAFVPILLTSTVSPPQPASKNSERVPIPGLTVPLVRSRAQSTSSLGSVRFEDPITESSARESRATRSSMTRASSGSSQTSEKRADALAELAEAKKLYYDSLMALKTKLLEMDRKHMEHPIPPVKARLVKTW